MPRTSAADATTLLTRPFCARLCNDFNEQNSLVFCIYASIAPSISSNFFPSSIICCNCSSIIRICGPVLLESITLTLACGCSSRYTALAAIAELYVPDIPAVIVTTNISSSSPKASSHASIPGHAVYERPLCFSRISSIL